MQEFVLVFAQNYSPVLSMRGFSSADSTSHRSKSAFLHCHRQIPSCESPAANQKSIFAFPAADATLRMEDTFFILRLVESADGNDPLD